MPELDQLFNNNRQWAEEIRASDPDFFQRLSQQQAPEYLWIGCADSRVPANQIVGLAPGGIFVHRNVANVVVYSDLNCLSVLQYAIDVLRVKHVIVCGHYGCGGVQAALANARFGLIDNWLRHVQDIALKHQALLDQLDDQEARLKLLCELNVIEQALNVVQTTIVQDAWARQQPLRVHGLIYGLQDGLLRNLEISMGGPQEVEERYQAALDSIRPR